MVNEIIILIFFLILSLFNLLAYRYWKEYIYSLIAIYAIMMNIFVTKQFDLFWFAVTWWNAIYWATFLLTDILWEHYWKEEAKKSVKIWFISMLFFVFSTQILILFEPNELDFANESIITLFSITPRILFASLLAYVVSQNLSVYIYDKIKKLTRDKYLFLRNNISTMFSQAIDTIIFTFVWLTSIWWFEWIIQIWNFWEICIATYVIKFIIALIDTPFVYLSYFVKRKEN